MSAQIRLIRKSKVTSKQASRMLSRIQLTHGYRYSPLSCLEKMTPEGAHEICSSQSYKPAQRDFTSLWNACIPFHVIRFSQSYLQDSGLSDDGPRLEEDKGVQLHRGPPRHLSIAVPHVHVACAALQGLAVFGAFRQRRDSQNSCQQPMHHHICVPASPIHLFSWKVF